MSPARHPFRLLHLAVFALIAIGLALVLAARAAEVPYPLALTGVACWIVAFAIMLGHAGPHSRR